jgi:putative peptide zinc metalloprotease protein
MAIAPEVARGETRDQKPQPSTPACPTRAAGVELLGEMQESGFEDAPWLVRRGDGQTIQLTELLYWALDAVDGQRDLEAIAAHVSEHYGKRASTDDVRFLLEEKLAPLGVLRGADGTEPTVEKGNPLLALRFKVVLSNERATRILTAPFQPVFHPIVIVPVIAAFVAVTGWLLFDSGLGTTARELLYDPALIVLAFALAALSAGFHEFGHAAACRYGGATPGAMGAGLYLVWPAFYTDVTDSYRLDRRGRLRTDLGGLYFNMVFALATVGVWALTGWDALLILVPVQLFQMMHQLLPFVRLDGYYILSDITGVPDLFARIKPTLLSLLPWHKADERVTALKPWVRVVVTLWVLAVIPILLFSLTLLAITLPRVLATAWDSAGLQREALTNAWGDGKYMTTAASALSLFAVALPVLSSVYMIGRIANRIRRWAWRRADDAPGGRPIVAGAALALAVGAAWLWWPNGEYRPLQPGERLRVQDGVRAVREIPTGRPALTPEQAGELEETPSPSTTAVPVTSTTVVSEDDDAPTAGSTGDEDAPADETPTPTTEAPSPTTTAPETTETTSP